MNLTVNDVRRANFKGFVKPIIPYTFNREHLPDNNIRKHFPELTDFQWNMLMNLLAWNVRQQPFADPTFWQTHNKSGFSKWLESWKV